MAVRRRVAVLSLGGTIAMVASEPGTGLRPALAAADLVEAVPQLADAAEVTARAVLALPGASLTLDHLAQVLRVAQECLDEGADGVVITQGTDTIEESAYLLDLWWPHRAPLVVTGAMRGASEPGADGPANLLAAVTAAGDPALAGYGVVVVMAGEIHAARHVRKTHSTHPGAFTSPNLGPIGMVRDGRAWLHAVLPAHEAIPPPARSGDAAPRVALLESVLGDDAELLRLVAGARYDGVVLGGFGVGHVCFAVAEEVSSLARHIPVVFASRTGAGGTHRRTYGFPGSEADLVARGAQPAGLLDHRKARLLLWATLAAGAGREEVARQFDLRGTG